MFIKSILDSKGPELITVSPGDTVRKVAKLFSEECIGFALVMNGNGNLVGSISERDIVQGVAVHSEVTGLPVADLMTTNVVTCHIEDSADMVRELMTEKRSRHVVVMDDNRELRGIVSIGDLTKYSLDQCQVDVGQMRDYISGRDYA